MKVQRTLADGTATEYNYKTIGGKTVSQYMNEWAKKKRAEQRAKEGFIVKKAQVIPRAIVEEMRQLHDELGMSFAKIGKIYKVSRYLVCSALSSCGDA